MIVGQVDADFEPIVELVVRGPTGLERRVPCIVDTGYSGALLLPANAIEYLRLSLVGSDRAELADGSIIEHPVFEALVEWDGIERPIEIDQADTAPLLGTALLRGYELTAQMRPHGKVTLRKMPPKRRARKRS